MKQKIIEIENLRKILAKHQKPELQLDKIQIKEGPPNKTKELLDTEDKNTE